MEKRTRDDWRTSANGTTAESNGTRRAYVGAESQTLEKKRQSVSPPLKDKSIMKNTNGVFLTTKIDKK